MEQTEKKKRQSTATVRKASKHGEHTQKMMAFRIDMDVVELLAAVPNKGRLINELLRAHLTEETGGHS